MYLKSLVLVSQEGPPPLVGSERQKMFEFSTSTLLEKALKALPSHFNFEQTFLFLLCIFFLGARVWPRRCMEFCKCVKRLSYSHKNWISLSYVFT